MASALVFWVDEKKTSIVSEECIPEETRHAGAVAQVLWAYGKRHQASIIQISKSIDELEKAEEAFMARFTKSNQPLPSSRRNNGGRSRVSTTASACQLSAALGEKPELTTKLKEDKRQAQEQDKETERCFKERVEEEDLTLLKEVLPEASQTKSCSVKRHLFNDDYSEESSRSDHAFSDAEDKPGSVPQCSRCTYLFRSVCPSSIAFLKKLESYVSNEAYEKDTEVVTYLPLRRVNPDSKVVEISRGSGLWIKKTAKAKMLVEAGSDPYKLTRTLLLELFEPSHLEKEGISARGKGSKKGIHDAHLRAMYEFISKYTDVEKRPGKTKDGKPKPPFKYPRFIREVNRKLGSVRRMKNEKMSPSSGETRKRSTKKPPLSSQKVPPKNPSLLKEAAATLSQQTPTKCTGMSNWKVTPSKLAPSQTSASPMKMQEKVHAYQNHPMQVGTTSQQPHQLTTNQPNYEYYGQPYNYPTYNYPTVHDPTYAYQSYNYDGRMHVNASMQQGKSPLTSQENPERLSMACAMQTYEVL